ncbi:MAG: D-alanyl-D-alanine carboxypeptidase/D-alanyl-D-alanine-endopeptidase, partial [Ilumatobacteraceae bacterium]
VLAALVPALVLGGCWRFADGRAPASEPNNSGSSTSSTVIGQAPAVALSTPVLSVRRAPAVLARDSNLSSLATALQPLLSQLDGNSCLSVSIDGKPVAAVNETASLRPASNVKLITASVALEVLGADHTYTTTVNGALGDGGVVNGDLVLVGGGDPMLSSEWWDGPNQKFPPFNVTSIEALADSIAAAGVTSITGSVVGDASRYDDEWYLPTWGDGLRFTEGGPLSALLINDSREASDRSSNDPVIGAATVLTQLLEERGVTVAGAPGKGSANGSAEIAKVVSQPLPAILQEMLTTSDNNTAELVLKEIGLKAGGAPTTVAGIAVVLQTLQSWGIPMDGITLVDGSGLSDENRLTCAALLAVVQHGSVEDAVGQGLPIGGQQGGTLYDAFQEGQPLSGIIRAKTGTLDNTDGVANKLGTKALSGYIPQAGGGAIEFSFLLNGETITNKTEYRPLWELFASIMAAYPTGPGVATLSPR